MSQSADVIVIGGGIAGLVAADRLSEADKRVILIEARERLGGRIWTRYVDQHPIELGAEFIHGRPSEILSVVAGAHLKITPVEGRFVAKTKGQWEAGGNLMEEVNQLFERMPAHEPDQTFASYLHRASQSKEAKEHAINFVQGFHAADPDKVSVHWLIQTTEAEEKIDGEKSFRLVDGYESLVHAVEKKIDRKRVEIHQGRAVTAVQWKPGAVTARSAGEEYRAARAVIAVPLTVLKAQAIAFDPATLDKDTALSMLEIGPVVRVSFLFRDKFWDRRQELRDFSFMFSDDPDFPTWWSLNPLPFPLLTGWNGGNRAQRFASYGEVQLIEEALASLARILGIRAQELREMVRSAHTHNWEADPYSRGAYSYAVSGGAGAFRSLAEPVADTLFFAGEATDWSGFNGTVHGAIASGLRAAEEILAL